MEVLTVPQLNHYTIFLLMLSLVLEWNQSAGGSDLNLGTGFKDVPQSGRQDAEDASHQNKIFGNTSSESAEPSIHPELSPDVVGVLGKEVRLACYVTDTGNKTISWIRHRDVHLLTVGRYTYTSDQRFSSHHVPLTQFWQLRIRNVTYSDSGKYECQISTTPPRGHQLNLRVVEPRTEILGGPDMHVDSGSTINLTCVSKFNPAPPPDVIWYHNNEEIGYDTPRGGVSVVIEKGPDKTTSHILVQKATSKDTGIFRCAPFNTVEAVINIHVLQGKNPDAWQINSALPLLKNSIQEFSCLTFLAWSLTITQVILKWIYV